MKKNTNSKLKVDKNAIPAFIPARVVSTTTFVVMAESIVDTLAQARRDINCPINPVPSIECMDVLFDDTWGVNAQTLREIAETAPGEQITFDVYPDGLPNDICPLPMQGKFHMLRLTHDRCKQYLVLKPFDKYQTQITFEFWIKPEAKAKPNAWIAKAVRKKPQSERPWFNYHWGNFGGDAYRAHLDLSLPQIPNDGVQPIPDSVWQFFNHLRLLKQRTATFDAQELAKAIKTASKISKVGSGAVTIKLTKRPLMDVYSKANGAGKAVTKVKVKYAGKDVFIHFEPQYMLDALSGMKGEVTMKVTNGTARETADAIYLKCGTKEAFVAQMNMA